MIIGREGEWWRRETEEGEKLWRNAGEREERRVEGW